MRFATMLRVKGGTVQERMKRRAAWQYPEGIKVIAEYWLQSPDPHIIIITETDSAAAIMAALAPWDDVFEATVTPALTAEEGLELAKKMMG